MVPYCAIQNFHYCAEKEAGPQRSIHHWIMKIGILGTGMVGEALGTKFAQLGHQVKMGSRTADNESAAKWVKATGAKASQGTFSDAAAFGEMAFICLKGAVFLDVAKTLSPDALNGKILVRTRVLNLFERLGCEFLSPVHRALSGSVTYEELHVLRLYFLCRS
jgi:hypothetical protein